MFLYQGSFFESLTTSRTTLEDGLTRRDSRGGGVEREKRERDRERDAPRLTARLKKMAKKRLVLSEVPGCRNGGGGERVVEMGRDVGGSGGRLCCIGPGMCVALCVCVCVCLSVGVYQGLP